MLLNVMSGEVWKQTGTSIVSGQKELAVLVQKRWAVWLRTLEPNLTHQADLDQENMQDLASSGF